jgi:excisionase family DNA binding protein
MNLYYTTFEAAQVLGVSLPTVVNWIKARRIKAHRTPGGHRRIAREDLATFMVRQGIPLPDELADAAPARRKVLVIAEAGPAREGTARQLSQAGFAVEQVSPGFAAGAAAARFAPEAVVLHASSPDGGDTLRALRADRDLANVPVVTLGPAGWVEALAAAGTSAVAAPPAAESLGKALSGALGQDERAVAARGRPRRGPG